MEHEFVEFVPDQLRDGVLYISIPYATVVHRCCCGCGNEVVTPLSPTDWKLIFDGRTISLHPSIGNWSFPCQSHYWIRDNGVEWAPRWSKEKIEAARTNGQLLKHSVSSESEDQDQTIQIGGRVQPQTPARKGWVWEWVWRTMFRK